MNYDYGNGLDNNDCENVNENRSINVDNITEIPYFIEEQKEQEQKKEGNLFCIISSACMGVSLLSIFLTTIISEGTMVFAGLVNITTTIIAYVLMIYVRIRYPKNIFGIVLMVIYIVLAIIAVFLVISAIIFLYLMYKMIEATCSGLG